MTLLRLRVPIVMIDDDGDDTDGGPPMQGPILGPHTPGGSSGQAIMGITMQGPSLGLHAPSGPNGLALMGPMQCPILGRTPLRALMGLP